MAKSLITIASRVWNRLNRYVVQQNERQMDLWGASLQYKRRYTNPDAAKRARAAQ